MFLKFISLIFYLKNHFNDLPRSLQVELVDCLEEYRDLCRINKFVHFERSEK